MNLADLLPTDRGGCGLRLWLKSSAYTQRLLLGESGDPWGKASEYLAYFTQAHGLLKPDVAVIEVGELFASWLRRHPEVQAELGAKRKLSYPLRRLLELGEPRAVLAEVVTAVLAHLRGQTPLVLSMPSPRRWLRQASDSAGRFGVELDDDAVEDAAMYVADLMRSVSEAEIGGLLLDERGGHGEATNLELYMPLVNVARHYRWPLALRLAGAVAESPALAAFAVVIGADGQESGLISAVNGSVRGIDVTTSLWTGAPVVPAGPGEFRFVEVPRDAVPEQVLERLGQLRAAA